MLKEVGESESNITLSNMTNRIVEEFISIYERMYPQIKIPKAVAIDIIISNGIEVTGASMMAAHEVTERYKNN